MAVIVSSIATESVKELRKFYLDLLGLNTVMDHSGIATRASGAAATAQINDASEGGLGTAVPDLSVVIGDVEVIYRGAKSLGHNIEFALTDETWCMRYFYISDPTEEHRAQLLLSNYALSS